MTLEDFFTLTEMKDGFTVPARVEELINFMQKEKNSLVKSAGDATRQWAAVAGTIAATENKECLDLFIQLDGLWFIDSWLKDAQTFPDETSDCFVEEAISALLLAVEKLQVNGEKLASSGLCITVKSLLRYKSSKVQDKARALFDSWKNKDVDFKSMDVEKAPRYNDPKLDNQAPETQFTSDVDSTTRSPGDQKPGSAEDGKVKQSNDQDSSQIMPDHADSKAGCSDMVASPAKLEPLVCDHVREKVCASDGILDSCVTALKQGTNGVISEALKPRPAAEDAKHESNFDMLPDTSGNDKVTSASGVSGSNDLSSRTDAKVDEEAAAKVAVEAAAKSNCRALDVKDGSPMKSTSTYDTKKLLDESSNGMDDSEQNGLEQGDGSALEEFKDQAPSISRLEDDAERTECKRYHQSESRYMGKNCEFARLTKTSKSIDIIQQTRDMDLEDGTVDALEVARLVAKEVEREVGGYCEQSGTSASSSSSSSSSSSDGISSSGGRQQDSPKSIKGEQDMQIDGPVRHLPTTEITPDVSGEAPLMSLCDPEANPKNHSQDLESSMVVDVALEPESNAEKSFLEFDLNQEFSCEDADHQVDTCSNPVSIISASRAVVSSGMPARDRKSVV